MVCLKKYISKNVNLKLRHWLYLIYSVKEMFYVILFYPSKYLKSLNLKLIFQILLSIAIDLHICIIYIYNICCILRSLVGSGSPKKTWAEVIKSDLREGRVSKNH